MTLSEISRRISLHLTVQKARSVGEDDKCMYRDGHGRMCAVGCLIDDAHYRPQMETYGVATPWLQRALVGSLGLEAQRLDCDTTTLLHQWQTYHDMIVGSDSYAGWLRDPTTGISPAEFHEKMAERFNFEP